MNYLSKIFNYLLGKKNLISKKFHKIGFVSITACVVSVFLIGANGFGDAALTNQERQNSIAKEKEKAELEESVEEEEELELSQVNQLKMPLLYRLHLDLTQTQTQTQTKEANMVLRKMDKPSLLLATTGQADSTAARLTTEFDATPNREPIHLSAEDEKILLRIVEAEVGAEDLYCRTLIANVVINRMLHQYYPETIKEVVFQHEGSVYQFSPIKDGRYYSIKVSDTTKKAVAIALSGYDNSDDALAFVNRRTANKRIMRWFDNNLTFVLKYDEVEFFTF